MTDSETLARKFLKVNHDKSSYIKKLPDFKSSGNMQGGLPDYLIIDKGILFFYEVKFKHEEDKSFPLSDFTDLQLKEFPKILKAEGNIDILIIWEKEYYIIPFEVMMNNFLKNINKRKSIPKKELEMYKYKKVKK